MKVIGKSEDGYMLTATEQDIKNLFGFGWSGDEFKKIVEDQLPRYRHNRSLVGLQIHADTAYLRLSWMKKRADEFERLCKQLRKTADMIEQHEPLFDAVIADKGAA